MRSEPLPDDRVRTGIPAEPDTASGPKPIRTLRARQSSLANPRQQLRLLADLEVQDPAGHPLDFEASLAACQETALFPGKLEIFQMNLGRLCNMTCRHCHVDAGPDRWNQVMDLATIQDCLKALDRCEAAVVDLTGGAPEMNPHFRYLVDELTARRIHVIDRCNLTILLIPKYQDLPEWLAHRGVEVVCSLPHYRPRNTDAQRGEGTFAKSITALQRLNAAGYGQGDPQRKLTLVVNPAGAFLAGPQPAMETEWKKNLAREHGINFDALLTLNNMPIARYLEWLQESGNLTTYMEKLGNSFNPATLPRLMCRNTLSIGYDGRVFHCDFNQMLDLEVPSADGRPLHIADFDPTAHRKNRVPTARHCFGCTAGAGSSCGGALAE